MDAIDRPQWVDMTPPMGLGEALELACHKSGRSLAEVVRTDFISETKLKARLAEEPDAAASVARFDPHWRIQFAGREAVVDSSYGPGYTCRFEDRDDLCVYGDGVVMTFGEVVGRPPGWPDRPPASN